jgi:hypothetical protein
MKMERFRNVRAGRDQDQVRSRYCDSASDQESFGSNIRYIHDSVGWVKKWKFYTFGTGPFLDNHSMFAPLIMEIITILTV